MRRFHLVRDEDVSGSSGVGTVAEGVEFSDGRVAMRWLVEPKSTAHYEFMTDLIHIHSHGGKSRVEFLDP